MQSGILALAATALLISACQDDDTVAIPDDGCGATALAELVGQPQEALADQTLPDLHRIIGPTDAVTTDYLENRLNVYLDENDMITRVACG